MATGGAIDELIHEAERQVTHDIAYSRELVQRAADALRGQRDVVREARLAGVRAALLVETGDLGAAAGAYRQARRNWVAAGRPIDVMWCTSGILQVQLLEGDFAAAETGLTQLRQDLDAMLHEDPGTVALDAVVQRQLGDALTGRGQLSRALRQYEVAENLFAALGDTEGIASVQCRRGIAALDAGRAHNALLEFDRSRATYLAAGVPSLIAMATTLAAEAITVTGQVRRALDVLDYVRPQLHASPWDVALHALVRAGALTRAGFAAEAHAEASAAEEVFVQIGALEYSARAILMAGRASLAWGRPRAAMSELAAAERLFSACGSTVMQMRTRLLQAEAARLRGETQAALVICERIMAQEDDATPLYVRVKARLIATPLVDQAAAAQLLDDASLICARAGIPELRVDLLVARARHARLAGDVTRAIEHLRRALTIARGWDVGSGDGGEIGSPSLGEATQDLILLLLERGDHASRVEALLRARTMKRAVVAVRGSHQPATLDEDERCRTIATLLTKAAVSGEHADVYGRNFSVVPPGSFVEYFVAGDDVLVFVVRDGHVDAQVLREATASSRRLVQAWQQECRLMAPGFASHLPVTSSAALDGLFDVLLAPVAHLLTDLEDDLTVIGHRHVHAIPFDALLDEVGPWYPSLLRPQQRPATLPDGGPARSLAALVLAVPDEKAPSITTEAEMIFRTLPSAEVLVAAEATKDALRQRSRGADLVHLACHGVFRPDDPMSSGLRLADGWLLAREIAESVSLEGAVVVLSACSSGLSPDYTAEPVGLVSACLSAGARGVVAALWPVDDEVTLRLMTHFYDALGAGLGPRAALRSARQQVAEHCPHPYYWAAFRFFDGSDALR